MDVGDVVGAEAKALLRRNPQRRKAHHLYGCVSVLMSPKGRKGSKEAETTLIELGCERLES